MPAYVRPIWNRDNPPLRLRADAVNHWLKLRHNFAPPKSNGKLRMEIGLDVDIKNAKARPLPWLAFLYTIKEGWLSPGALEVNPYWGTYNRSFQIGSVPVDAKVGACWDGTPHVEVGVGSVPIMVAAAVAMLAAGKPINVSRKEVGGWRLNLRMPRARSEYANATIQPAVEVDVGVQRIQRGLVLNLSQLSPVLRLRQD